MSLLHFLNVNEGDCSIIEHNTGHVSVIDVCNASADEPEVSKGMRLLSESGRLGNFNQKEYPENPITYMKDRNINDVFRFILTHPDMDHMDGIESFFEKFPPTNFWDTDNACDKDFESGGRYKESDWNFYCSLRDDNPQSDPKRLTLHSGATGHYYNRTKDRTGGGDGLTILAPTPTIVSAANESGDFNDCSYVILYRTGSKKVLLGGDSHDGTWEHILEKHEGLVKNIDLLIAPHHGRKSGRSYDFLDVLKPKLTLFGNAPHQDLAYAAWNNRDLSFITNNQAGSVIAEIGDSINIYVTHKPFAQKYKDPPPYSAALKAFLIGEL